MSQAPFDLPFRPRTMLSIVHPQAQDLHHHHHPHHSFPHPHPHHQPAPTAAFYTHSRPMPHRVLEPQAVRASSEASTATASSVSSSSSSVCSPPSSSSSPAPSPSDASVVQALEIARESPDGGHDPTISKILEGALAHIWGKVQAQPDSYVMTRDEFSIFNYFQHRFVDDATARLARKRYWDNLRG